MTKVVSFDFFSGDFEWGFEVAMQIAEEEGRTLGKIRGKLPQATHIPKLYGDWREAKANLPQIKQKQCAEALKAGIKEWLSSPAPEWQKVREELRGKLQQDEEVRVLIQSADTLLIKLPWQEWDIFANTYRKSDVAFSLPEYQQVSKAVPVHEKAEVRILAILGDSKGINLEKDKQYLEELTNAEIVFLQEPNRQQLSDNLWKQPWDMLFFAGHSYSKEGTGKFYINENERLTIEELKNGLKNAIDSGLQLAIFNSCDGLELAKALGELGMAQAIVMREKVKDTVAQNFLRYFLEGFVRGKSLYLAVRYARERLHDDGIDDRYPGSVWLPAIFQNPAAASPSWQELVFGKFQEKEKAMSTKQIASTLEDCLVWIEKPDPQEYSELQLQVVDAIKHQLEVVQMAGLIAEFQQQPTIYKPALLSILKKQIEDNQEFAGKLAALFQELESEGIIDDNRATSKRQNTQNVNIGKNYGNLTQTGDVHQTLKVKERD